MNKSYILILFAICFLIPLINAQLPDVKSGNCVNIKIPLNATWVNITTLTYPNQTMIHLSVRATQIGNTFYYNSFCDTEKIGYYSYEFFDDTGFSSGNNFKVTKTENSLSQAESNISTSTIFFISILGIVFILFGLALTRQGFWLSWTGVFCIIFGFILFYYDLSLVNLYINSIAISGSTASGIFLLFTKFLKILPYIVTLIVVFGIVRLLREIIKNKKNDDGWDNNNY